MCRPAPIQGRVTTSQIVCSLQVSLLYFARQWLDKAAFGLLACHAARQRVLQIGGPPGPRSCEAAQPGPADGQVRICQKSTSHLILSHPVHSSSSIDLLPGIGIYVGWCKGSCEAGNRRDGGRQPGTGDNLSRRIGIYYNGGSDSQSHHAGRLLSAEHAPAAAPDGWVGWHFLQHSTLLSLGLPSICPSIPRYSCVDGELDH